MGLRRAFGKSFAARLAELERAELERFGQSLRELILLTREAQEGQTLAELLDHSDAQDAIDAGAAPETLPAAQREAWARFEGKMEASGGAALLDELARQLGGRAEVEQRVTALLMAIDARNAAGEALAHEELRMLGATLATADLYRRLTDDELDQVSNTEGAERRALLRQLATRHYKEHHHA